MSFRAENQRNWSLRYFFCNLCCCCCPTKAASTSKVKSSQELASACMYRGGVVESEREEHWKELFQASPLPMAVISREGRIVATNSVMRELFAIPRDSARTINIEDIIAEPEEGMATPLATQKFLRQFYSHTSVSSLSAFSYPEAGEAGATVEGGNDRLAAMISLPGERKNRS